MLLYPDQWYNPPENYSNAFKAARQVRHPWGGEHDTMEHPRWDADQTYYGTDEFAFSALPGGRRWSTGGFSDIGSSGHWWTTSEYSAIDVYSLMLTNHTGYLFHGNWNKAFGKSVRCVKDQ